jgi:hypothetical protein
MSKTITLLPNRKLPQTKEEFIIEWVLLRAAAGGNFSGLEEVGTANEIWEKIQKLSYKN